jgi:predicted GNAT family N-acyltransferase
MDHRSSLRPPGRGRLRPGTTVSVRRAKEAELDLCFAIRHEVFVREQGVPEPTDRDGLDSLCVHWLAFEGERAIGTARLRFVEGGRGKAERVAVLVDQRGRGVGAALLAALEAEALVKGCSEVVLHAQVSTIPFYERLGFVAEGDPFDEAGIPHRLMRRTL